jgi:ribosome-binding protein aMBF1 (putative translation factor)
MNTINELVKEAIKRYASKQGWDNKTLAAKVGKSEEMLAYVLSENSITASHTLEVFCNRLNLTPELSLLPKEN